MILEVDILPASSAAPVPRTRLHVDHVPAGAEWKVFGVADGHEWQAAHGVSTGSARWLTDPMAPLNIESTYRLEAGGDVVAAPPITRPFGPGQDWDMGLPWREYRGWDLITDLSGRQVAAFIRPHEHARSWEVRSSTLAVGRVPVARYATPGAPTSTLSARTTGVSTHVLTELVESGDPLIVLHQRSPMGRDSVPLSQVVTVTSASDALASRRSQEDRIWSLGLTPARPPWRYTAPVATWADVRRHFGTVGAVRDSGLTHEQVAAGDWLSW